MSKELCRLGFNTDALVVGDSLGMLLTLEKEVHWLVNDVWIRSARVKDYPLDTPMWGVVDVYALCKQVKAEICTGKLLLVQCMCSHMCSLPHSVQVQP